jgi:hypothetical protein
VAPASAQFGVRQVADPATGETYRVEIGGGFWNPTPQIIISSESLGIPGDDIDFVSDLGIERKRFRELRVVLRPGRKHKLRLGYLPMKYEADTTLRRTIVFNGIRYPIGIPVTAALQWKAWRFGYEYDVIYRSRGFFGIIAEAKYTDIQISLDSPVAAEFTSAKAPIPAVGGIGRVYVVPNISATLEITGFKLPERVDENFRGRYLDGDLYGTVNFADSFGVQLGYRSLDVMYRVEEDAGDLTLKGVYFTGVVRF